MKKIKECWQNIGFALLNIIENCHSWFLKYYSDDPLYNWGDPCDEYLPHE